MYGLIIIIVCCFTLASCGYPALILQDQTDLDNYVYIKHCILTSYDYNVEDNFNDVTLIWYYINKYNLTNSVINFSLDYNIKSCLSNHVYANATNSLIINSLNNVGQNGCMECEVYIYVFIVITVIYLMLIAVYCLCVTSNIYM